ncbi:MAG: DEAD/DEAH box helicase [Saprospiraceae bacterium]|nr:DEAD/DEAH box helicase [Bacteroidia bacterium]NNE16231.1 DEAD/DEAH box helicase [Saprospiraceae bacterium]
MKFEDLKIIEPIMKALQHKGYSQPTPIQAKAIPHILNRKDVLGCAQTGTGKTAAFAIPIIQLIHNIEKNADKPVLRSLIVTPTRELAIQIDENIQAYSKNTNIKHAVIFGGVKQGQQVSQLKKGVHILVATPGRLLDLIQQGFISLNHIKIFVLDEADRMLDMGFINDIRKLLKLLPEQRQSLFFSATMPKNIIDLSSTILKNPVKVEVAAISSTAETITQYLYYTNRTDKNKLLLHIINKHQIDQVLIFVRTKHGADRIFRFLQKNNIKSASIHGDRAQNQRQKALSDFKAKNITALVATDIAARGIDIEKLTYTINLDVPNLPETYVHRIGRAGRAGEDGVAISICEPEENSYIKDIQKLIGKKITVIDDNPFPQTEKPMTEAEKKEWNKEKQRRKQEFFANRKAKKTGGQQSKKDRPKGNKGKNKSDSNSNKIEKSPTSEKRDFNKSKPKKSKAPSFNQRKEKQGNSEKPAGKKRRSNTSMRKKLPPKLGEKYMWPLE